MAISAEFVWFPSCERIWPKIISLELEFSLLTGAEEDEEEAEEEEEEEEEERE